MITILGQNYIGEGDTFENACRELGLSWKDIKGRGLITVWKGGIKKERMVNKSQIVRLVSNPLTQSIWAANFNLLFK